MASYRNAPADTEAKDTYEVLLKAAQVLQVVGRGLACADRLFRPAAARDQTAIQVRA
jgi:hypothetical protein